MRSFLTIVLMCCSLGGVSSAAEVAMAVRKPTSIPAQALRPALQLLSRERDVQVVFRTDLVADLRTQGASGELTIEEALTTLLDGTGLTYRYLDDQTITIVRLTVSSMDAGPGAESDIAQADFMRLAQTQGAVAENAAAARANAASDDSNKRPQADDGRHSSPAADEVVVTGTNIRGVSNPAVPLLTFDKAEIEGRGYATVSDFIQTLPQNFRGGETENNIFSAGGNTGLNLGAGTGVNLRGLGSDSTLVLLNGHRLAAAGVGNFVDVSSIPLTAIDHIEVLTDGASAIYGSDAVSGVVNVVLRDDYDGAQTTARYGTVTRGSSDEIQFGQLFGRKWSNGHALFSYERYERAPLNSKSVPATEAADRTDLMSKTSRDSIYLNADQQLTDRVGLYGGGSYDTRKADSESLVGTLAISTRGKTEQYNANLGATAALGRAWQADFMAGAGRAVTAYTPTVDAFTYSTSKIRSKIRTLDAKLDGPLMAMSGGDVKAAAGAHYRSEDMTDENFGALVPVSLDRTVSALFGEIFFPLVKSLSLSVAARYEDYSDFGTTFNPKVGIAYSPVERLTLRGTYGSSFRAPVLFELYEGFGSVLVDDFPNPAGTTTTTLTRTGNNAALGPEEARILTLGADWTGGLDSAVRLGATFYSIEFDNRIVSPLDFSNRFSALVDDQYSAFVILNPTAAQFDAALIDFLPQGNVFNGSINYPVLEDALANAGAIFDDRLQNIAETRTSGIDLNLSYTQSIARSKLIYDFSGNYILQFENRVSDSSPFGDAYNRAFEPVDLRFRVGMSWVSGNFAANLAANYTDDYKDVRFTPVSPVDSWTTIDLGARYDFTPDHAQGMLNGLELTLSVTNLTDENPPYVFGYGFNFDGTNATARGRFVALQATKSW